MKACRKEQESRDRARAAPKHHCKEMQQEAVGICFLQLSATRAGQWRCSHESRVLEMLSRALPQLRFPPRRRQQLCKAQPGLHAHLASEVVKTT